MRNGVAARALGVAALAAAGVAAAGLAGAAKTPMPTQASAAAFRILVPGQPPVDASRVVGPPNASADVTGFAYPDDGSIVRAGSATSSVVAQPGPSASAQALTSSLAVTLFGGEITVASVTTSATAAAGSVTATADTSASQVQGLVVLGQDTPAAAGTQVPLADWGLLDVLVTTSATRTTGPGPNGADATVTALRIKLTADHGGLVAGTEVDVGVSSASASVSDQVATATTGASTTPQPAPPPRKRPRRRIVEPGTSRPGAPPQRLVRPLPSGVRAALSSRGYVFPVYGPATFGDTFGAPRSDVAGGWHHGEDIFAPIGTPLLAVADGTVHTVGWNDIGGWRLWLRDGQGNEFYYAHLSAYSPLAVDGKQVKAGDVLGFLGKSGDARFSVPHLHFEIHPVSLAALGYDGAVAPFPFLVAWRRAQDVPFADGRRYVTSVGGLPRVGAPAPGAVLLQANDVSSASGLVPGAIAGVLTTPATRAIPRNLVD